MKLCLTSILYIGYSLYPGYVSSYFIFPAICLSPPDSALVPVSGEVLSHSHPPRHSIHSTSLAVCLPHWSTATKQETGVFCCVILRAQYIVSNLQVLHTHTTHANTQYSAEIFSLGPETPARDTLLGWGWGGWAFSHHTPASTRPGRITEGRTLCSRGALEQASLCHAEGELRRTMTPPCFRGESKFFFSLPFSSQSFFFVRTFFFFPSFIITIMINPELLKQRGSKPVVRRAEPC